MGWLLTFAGMLPQILFWFPVGVLGLLSVIFLCRRIYSELPFFFLYTSSSFVFGVMRYSAFRLNSGAFFYVYWISELAGAVIFSLAIYEIFFRRIFPRFLSIRFYRKLFPSVALVVLLLTVAAALQSSDRAGAFRLASRIFDFIRTAFLLFFMALMLVMGRQGTRYESGITLGFGIQAAAALANAAVRGKLGHRSRLFDTAETITFELACVIWLITFLKPKEPDHLQPAASLDPDMLRQARKWETALKDWLTPGKHR
jgi:hypothetical protein